MYRLLHFLNLPVDVQEVCVFTAPLFSAFTALSAYALASEVRGRGPGLVAASLAAVVPSYVSRSVAGSYDNEGVAIFALVTVFWLYVKTLKVKKEKRRVDLNEEEKEKEKRSRGSFRSKLKFLLSKSSRSPSFPPLHPLPKQPDGLPGMGGGPVPLLPLHGSQLGRVHFYYQPTSHSLLGLRLFGKADPQALCGLRSSDRDRHARGGFDPGRGLQRRADERALRRLFGFRRFARRARREGRTLPPAPPRVRGGPAPRRGRRGLLRCRGRGRDRGIRGREPDVWVDGEESVAGEEKFFFFFFSRENFFSSFFFILSLSLFFSKIKKK